MDWAEGVSMGGMPAPLFHNQYDKYSVHKSAAITEKGRDLRTPRVVNTVHCCQ